MTHRTTRCDANPWTRTTTPTSASPTWVTSSIRTTAGARIRCKLLESIPFRILSKDSKLVIARVCFTGQNLFALHWFQLVPGRPCNKGKSCKRHLSSDKEPCRWEEPCTMVFDGWKALVDRIINNNQRMEYSIAIKAALHLKIFQTGVLLPALSSGSAITLTIKVSWAAAAGRSGGMPLPSKNASARATTSFSS